MEMGVIWEVLEKGKIWSKYIIRKISNSQKPVLNIYLVQAYTSNRWLRGWITAPFFPLTADFSSQGDTDVLSPSSEQQGIVCQGLLQRLSA